MGRCVANACVSCIGSDVSMILIVPTQVWRVDVELDVKHGRAPAICKCAYVARLPVLWLCSCLAKACWCPAFTGVANRRAYVRRLGMRFTKTTFPLQLAYAMTGHKSQGATITGPCLIDLHRAFQRGMVYTMLSRVRSRQQLALVRDLEPNDIAPVLLAGL
jgi:hypothetical protein